MKSTLIKTAISSEVYTRTYEALRNLYLNSKEMQEFHCDNKYNLSNSEYKLQDYCTIKFAGARQIGHTTALCKLLYNEFFNNKGIIFTHSVNAITLLKNNPQLHIIQNNVSIYSIKQRNIPRFNDLSKIDFIAVDCTSYINEYTIKEVVYPLANMCLNAHKNTPFYLFLIQ